MFVLCFPQDTTSNAGFDDSMSSLLTGQKKKTSGMTSYQRPGPPTPSRHSRLSLGSSSAEISMNPRDILKENYDPNSAVSSSKKTPARFKIFASRFSMGVPKDEVSVFRCLFPFDDDLDLDDTVKNNNVLCDKTFSVNNNVLDSID